MNVNKQILLVISFFIISVSLYAQGRKNYDKITEIKGINNTYEMGESGIDYGVWNKQSWLMYTRPSFLEFEIIPSIEIKNRASPDALVRTYFKSYFTAQTSFTYSYLYFYFFADNNGNIKEIYISYPKNVGVISGNVIEQFETALLKSDVKLSFDNSRKAFRGSQWVGREVMYHADKLKDL